MQNSRLVLASIPDSSEEFQRRGPVWLRLPTAAALIDLSPGALKQRLYRQPPPDGVVRRLGRSILIHRERFLRWIEVGPNTEATGR